LDSGEAKFLDIDVNIVADYKEERIHEKTSLTRELE
jgi:hypothetical protein